MAVMPPTPNLQTLALEFYHTDTGAVECFEAGDISPQERCEALEQGAVLVIPQSPFTISEQQLESLVAKSPTADASFQLHSQAVSALLQQLFPPYHHAVRLDSHGFCDEEVLGHPQIPSFELTARKPLNGDRLLQVVTNVHPTREHRWVTSTTFESLLNQFQYHMSPLYHLRYQGPFSWLRPKKALRSGSYDRWMREFNEMLKTQGLMKSQPMHNTWEFPAGATWIYFSDAVTAAKQSGQYALSTTWRVERHALVLPEKSPLALLKQVYWMS